MLHSQKLKTRSFYEGIFRQIESKIKKKCGSEVIVEHVGNTSIAKPAGKGDVDVYVGYRTQAEMRRLKKVLIGLFGKPARVTSTRVRFNEYAEGIQVEVQLIDMESIRKSVNLKEYFKKYPKEAETYSHKVNKIRQDSLGKMKELKEGYKCKANEYWKSQKV